VNEDILSFEDHRRQQDENASLVRCARCGKMILATTTRCPECAVHFQGGGVVALAVVLMAAVVIIALALR